MKILYISNRPAVLAETLGYVRAHMPWVTEAVVVAPASMDLGDTPNISIIDETDLLGIPTDRLRAMDHVSRNITLRRAAVAEADLGERFILSDDDYRPLRPIPVTDFIEDGRMHGYVSHFLDRWRDATTDYDHAQRTTSAALSWWGADQGGYGAHMPQVIDRTIWTDAFAEWDALHRGADAWGANPSMVDEWSLHHNWGRRFAPTQFISPRRYRTLGWPQYPHEWARLVRPQTISFENFYPELYGPGGLFAGIPTACDPSTDAARALVKIQRWNELDYRMDRLTAPEGVDTPWHATMLRRGLLRSLQGAHKVAEYVGLGERQRSDDLTAFAARDARGLDLDLPC